MAFSFRTGCFCAPKFDEKLIRLVWQWGCQCRCRCRARVKLLTCAAKFGSEDLGKFTAFVGRTITTATLEKTRANLTFQLISAAKTAISHVESVNVDVERPRTNWDLNKEQVAAVETSDNYVRVVAGPGSGKTRVLTHRIAHMITGCNVDPSTILCITFTNKAAQELCERLNNLLDKKVSRALMVGTIHGVCASILRSEQISEYHIDNEYIIYDERDSERVVKRILQEIVGYSDATSASNGKENLNCDAKLEGISDQNMNESVTQRLESALLKDLVRCKLLTGTAPERSQLLQFMEKYDMKKSDKKRSVSADAVNRLLYYIKMARHYNMQTFIAKRNKRVLPCAPYGLNEFAFKMAEIYELELRRSNAADFEDLLYLVAYLLHNKQRVREKYRKKWRHVLVDEFQDIDEVQYELIRLLSIGNKGLFVVGDINQAIYAWRGANAAYLQYALEHDFPNIITLKLIRNYRSSRNILKLASVVLENDSTRHQTGSTNELNLLPVKSFGEPICVKELSSPIEEANFIAFEIQRLVDTGSATWGGFAILYRTHAQSFLLQSSLQNLQIPYVAVGSTPFYSHKEIKYVLAYLHLVAKSENQIALESIINIPPRGIGEKTLARLKKWASDKNLTLSSALQRISGEDISHKELNIMPQKRTTLLQFWELIGELQSLSCTETIGTIIEAIIERTNLKSYLQRLDDIEKRFDRVSVLQKIGDSATHKYGIGKMSLLRFLDEISSDQENLMGGKDENRVKLMTLHAAKGLEFDSVFITGLQSGLLPLFDEKVVDERRLFYVGITRAIQRLYLTFSTTNLVRGEPHKARPSEFIKEILRSPELKEVN